MCPAAGTRRSASRETRRVGAVGGQAHRRCHWRGDRISDGPLRAWSRCSDRIRNRAAAAGPPLAGACAVRVGAGRTGGRYAGAKALRSPVRSARRGAAPASRVAVRAAFQSRRHAARPSCPPRGCRVGRGVPIRTGTSARLPNRCVRRTGRSPRFTERRRGLETGNDGAVQHSPFWW